jgi:Dyp-type peroxidase family
MPQDLPLRTHERIQGNILAAFGTKHQSFIFLALPDDKQKARKWLDNVRKEIAFTNEVVDNVSSTSARVALGLTWTGLAKLSENPVKLQDDLQHHQCFLSGAAERQSALGHSTPHKWVVENPAQRVDAVLTVASADASVLDARIQRLDAFRQDCGLTEVFSQRCVKQTDEKGEGIEHFGFRDSISQPGVLGFSHPDPDNSSEPRSGPGSQMIAAGEFVLGYDPEPDEKHTCQKPAEWMKDGSFQVVLRLKQDVGAFRKQVERQHIELLRQVDTSMSTELLEASVVGRWKNGTSLVHAPAEPRSIPKSELNKFDFDGSSAVPEFSHIRKMNPRSDRLQSKRHRILRRGIPYGPKWEDGESPDTERGLLFNAFMACIENQFEFLQSRWGNERKFPWVDTGADPVTAEQPGPVKLYVGAAKCLLDFGGFVTLTGAVYAFAASRSTLDKLANGDL